MRALRRWWAMGMSSALLLGLVVALPVPARADTSTWTSDADWRSGTIAPGAGVYVVVVSSFTWTPALITPERT